MFIANLVKMNSAELELWIVIDIILPFVIVLSALASVGGQQWAK